MIDSVPEYSWSNLNPRSGPSTQTAVANESADMQSGAITVTAVGRVSPTPVLGSTMCE